MHYLIDGHNLIANMPDIELADQHDEVHLVLKLRSWAAASRKRRVTVIFDGGIPGGRARRMSSGQVKVVFAPQGIPADDLLIAQIGKVKNPAEYIVVTTDREIIAAARQRRMASHSSEQFAEELRPREVEAPDPEETSDPQLDEAEINEWLALFGPEPEIKPYPKPSAGKRPPKTEQKKSLDDQTVETPKEGERRLTEEELDLWLSLFGGGDKD